MYWRIIHFIASGICLAAFALTSGCNAKPEEMAPELQSFPRTQPGAVSVTAIGASDTNDFWSPIITKADFAKAVEISIGKCGVLKSVQQSGAGDYHLEANLRAMDIPVSADSTYRIFVSWKLRTSSNNRVVWDADIVSSAKHSFGQNIKNTLAAAAQDNILQAMNSLEAAIPLRDDPH